MKRFRFPKGIRQLNIPFMLHDLSPWQDQVYEEMNKVREEFGTSKSSRIGYEIVDGYAQIQIKSLI